MPGPFYKLSTLGALSYTLIDIWGQGIYIAVYLSIRLSSYLSIYPSIFLSIYLATIYSSRFIISSYPMQNYAQLCVQKTVLILILLRCSASITLSNWQNGYGNVGRGKDGKGARGGDAFLSFFKLSKTLKWSYLLFKRSNYKCLQG